MSVVAETLALGAVTANITLIGVLASQLPRRRNSRGSTPQSTRAAADTTPAALGSIPGFADSQVSMSHLTPVADLVRACPRCGSDSLQKRGTVLKPNGTYQQYRCHAGHWFRVLLDGELVRRAS